MTRLDAAALHRWLTGAITAAENGHDSWLHDANRMAEVGAHTIADENRRAAIDSAAQAVAYRDIDGWLRSTATAQLHRPGHDLNPTALLNTGQVEADVDQLRTWILERAAATPIETRAKTYTAVANQLDRFALQPDPFPHDGDTPGPRWWPHRLQLAAAWARDLIR